MPRNSDTRKRKAKVLIVDDHPAVREALSIRIGHAPDLTVCGQAAGIADALRVVDDEHPDIAVIDINLEAGDGLDLIKRIKNHDERVRVLIWSMYREELFAERALRAGAHGYITKQHATDDIVDAIRQVLAGQVYLSSTLSAKILHRSVGPGDSQKRQPTIDTLSDRELEVFRLIGQGTKTSDIAAKLHISVRTVWTYRDRIREKLQLNDAAELVHQATRWAVDNE